MGDFFGTVLNSPGNLSKQFLGQNYAYQDHIRTPNELGMSSEGSISSIGKNIGGLISYVELLVAGSGSANKNPYGRPLGDKFFLKTGGDCLDVKTGNNVSRYIYIDNVPDGTLPFISSGLDGYKFDSLRGLVPGMLTNVAKIEPTKMFSSFVLGNSPYCMEVNREVIDENGRSGSEKHHLIRADILSSTSGSNELSEFDSLESKLRIEKKKNEDNKEGFGVNNKNIHSKHTNVKKQPIEISLPYGPERPYYPSIQSAYKPSYKKERPHKQSEIPEYEMPVIEIPEDSKYDDNIKDDKTKIYADDITHNKVLCEVPQVKQVNIKEVVIDDTNKINDYSKMPDDTFLKMYYSTLGLFGLYLFLKLVEKK